MVDSLLSGSHAARERFFEEYEELLLEQVHEQAPHALFITCVDSRIMPENLFGLVPGDWLVLRNVGNVVPPYAQLEISVAAALEFALDYLQVPHIIVCGHTNCGAITALQNGVDLSRHPGLARWVELMRPLRLENTATHDELARRNVLLQLEHLRSYPAVRAAEATGTLSLHGWLYDLPGPAVVNLLSEG